MTHQHEQPTSPSDDFEWINAWAAGASPTAPLGPSGARSRHPRTVVAMRDFTIVAATARDLPDVNAESSDGQRADLLARDLAAVATVHDMLDIAQAQAVLQAQSVRPSASVGIGRAAAACPSTRMRSDRAVMVLGAVLGFLLVAGGGHALLYGH